MRDLCASSERVLSKHQKQVTRFYKKEINVLLKSEQAKSYQKRLQKNKDRLFVFLEGDGIPWNNNNAENAVKAFVYRRRQNGPFAKTTIDGYLRLLSISQTLKYRDRSFLEFLRSGETDIDKFCKT